MRFVDREKEMARLQQLLKADSSSFIIIRGRRRIGKSTLIGKMLGEKDIYYEAYRTDPANQMAGLSRMVAIDYKKNVAGKFVLVDGDKYALILRLTNMELKSIE